MSDTRPCVQYLHPRDIREDGALTGVDTAGWYYWSEDGLYAHGPFLTEGMATLTRALVICNAQQQKNITALYEIREQAWADLMDYNKEALNRIVKMVDEAIGTKELLEKT